MATLIHDLTELQNISLDLAGDYELANNIVGGAFTPLGTFTGSLDGKDYIISDLTITVSGAGDRRGALFLRNKGTIQNLGIEGCSISVTATNPSQRGLAAGIVVWNDTTGIITNCHVTGTIQLTVTATTAGNAPYGGGFVTWNYGNIIKSYSTANVTIIGNPSPYIYGGGFVPLNGGSISESYSTGNVIITASAGTDITRGGGFVSENSGAILNSYAKGNVTATGGDVNNYAAGFVDYNYSGTLINCYSIGIPIGASGVGGFCRLNNNIITDCFWDTQTSGTAVSDGGTGKTTAEMKTRPTFTGWDFSSIWSITTYCNNGYPCLLNTTPNCALIPSIQGEQVKEIITLEAMRNIEMSCMGRIYVDEEGNLTYESRYARNP